MRNQQLARAQHGAPQRNYKKNDGDALRDYLFAGRELTRSQIGAIDPMLRRRMK